MKNSPQGTMGALSGPLGLADDDASIAGFIDRHRPLDNRLHLAEAPFWCCSQARFISETLKEDSDWSLLIDSFSNQLRNASPALAGDGAKGRQPMRHAVQPTVRSTPWSWASPLARP